jgi:hypothetical protein
LGSTPLGRKTAGARVLGPPRCEPFGSKHLEPRSVQALERQTVLKAPRRRALEGAGSRKGPISIQRRAVALKT